MSWFWVLYLEIVNIASIMVRLFLMLLYSIYSSFEAVKFYNFPCLLLHFIFLSSLSIWNFSSSSYSGFKIKWSYIEQ